jgi:hemoglobin
MSLLEMLGGKALIERVVKRFYDKVYADPWLSQYFVEVPRTHIEKQQLNFIVAALGGPDEYHGRPPSLAHPHMMITEELFTLRQKYMAEALDEAGAGRDLSARWLKIEGSFRGRIVKQSPADCEKRHREDQILDFKKP